jgi:hypothetical protein
LQTGCPVGPTGWGVRGGSTAAAGEPDKFRGLRPLAIITKIITKIVIIIMIMIIIAGPIEKLRSSMQGAFAASGRAWGKW